MNNVQRNYQSLGHNYILPSSRAIQISAGQGHHSTPGYAGRMSCTVQILLRMLYGYGSSPSENDFQLKLFELSPMGSIYLQEIAQYGSEYGDYNLFHSVRLVIQYMSEEMTRLYVPPGSHASKYDHNGKLNPIKKMNYYLQ